jgi:branched-chain amino acid aminotransferase
MSDLLALWHDGRIITDDRLTVDPSERGLLLGDGVFETIAVFGGKATWRADHLDRMLKGAEAFGIPIAREKIESAIDAALHHAGDTHGILRVTLTRGPTGRGLAVAGDAPTLLCALAPWRKKTLFRPARLATSTVRRNEGSPASRHKTLSYADNILAAREVAAQATDALMLNTHGRLACAAIANVFLLEGKRIVTPPLADGALPGIARKHILDLAFTLGFDTVERSIVPEEARSADLLFLSNSLRLMAPVSEFDGASGSDPEALRLLFERLCERIADETGTDPRSADLP